MKKPGFVLKALNKATDARTGRLGVGFQNEDGSISLLIDDCVVLQRNPDLIFTLFPNRDLPSAL